MLSGTAIEYWDSGSVFSEEIVISMYHEYPISEERFYSNTGSLDEYDFEEGGSFSDVAKAVEAACSARFEHGEHGA
jgi:hypothetical protein